MSRLHMNDDLNYVLIQINQADPAMMLRELFANCRDAILLATDCPREKARIEFSANAGGKLEIFNNGMGMSAQKLEEVLTNIGKSGAEKQQDVDNNFGQGAKLTILSAYEGGEGAVYITCCDGNVSMAQLCWQDGVPGLRVDEDGFAVTDVTSEYAPDDRQEDWCRVILIGMDQRKHKTAKHPYTPDEQPQGGIHWLSKTLNQRFYDIESIATVRDDVDKNKENRRQVRGLKYAPIEWEERISVGTDGVCIRYAWTEKDSKEGRGDWQKGYGNHCCLVFKGEVYGAKWERQWTSVASRFGFPFIGARLIVEVLLPDAENIRPDLQRKQLELIEGNRRTPLHVDAYEEVIKEHIPEYLLEKIAAESESRQEDDLNKLKDALEEEYRKPEQGGKRGFGGDTKAGSKKPKTRFCPKCVQLMKDCVCERCEKCARKLHQCVCGKTEKPTPPQGNHDGDDKRSTKAGQRYASIEAPQPNWIDAADDQFESVKGSLASWEGDFLYLNEVHPCIDEATDRLMGNRSKSVRQAIRKKVKTRVTQLCLEFILNAHHVRIDNAWDMHKCRAACSRDSITAAVGNPRQLEQDLRMTVAQNWGKSNG